MVVQERMCKSQMYNVLSQCKFHIEDVTGPLECMWKFGFILGFEQRWFGERDLSHTFWGGQFSPSLSDQTPLLGSLRNDDDNDLDNATNQ